MLGTQGGELLTKTGRGYKDQHYRSTSDRAEEKPRIEIPSLVRKVQKSKRRGEENHLSPQISERKQIQS